MENLTLPEGTEERIWKGRHSLEIFTLETNEMGFIGGGIITSAAFNIRYRVHTDLLWKVNQLSIEDLDRPWVRLGLRRAADDLWFDYQGLEIKELAGSAEVDISASPFTNTIALQKLGNLKEKTFKVVYIHMPDLSLSVVDQMYTVLGPGKFKYDNLTSGFSAELSVDQYGLLLDYPGLFKIL
jgi:hypothetical protein